MNKYKPFEEWLEDLGFSESSNNYQAVNPFVYIGKYQMGEGALIDTGYDVSEITDPSYYAPRFHETKQEKFDQILNTPNHMIQNITQKVNPPTLTIPNDVINKMPIKPLLSEEEWRKQLKRKRMGLL